MEISGKVGNFWYFKEKMLELRDQYKSVIKKH